ncbi:MAG: PPC domain-containing protein [Planctomycetota bacterium]
MRRLLFPALSALALLALAGCVDEELDVHVQPDGAARLELNASLETSLQALRGLFGSGSQTDEERAARAVASYLATFEGVVAWTDVQVSREGDRVRCQGTGWVPELGALRRREPGQGERTLRRWSLEGEAQLEAELGGLGQRFSASYPPELVLEKSPEDLARLQRTVDMGMGGLQLLQRGMRSRLRVHLPSAPLSHEGWDTDEGTRLELENTLAWAKRQNAALVAALTEVGRRFRAGELERDAAAAEVEALREAAGTCRVSWARGAADPEFTRGLTAAREAWPGSPWEVALAEARAEREREAATREAQPDEVPEPELPDDAFEPNDHFRRATALEEGVHEGLTLTDKDWYAVTVPAGKEAELRLRYEGEEYALALESFYRSGENPLELEFREDEDGVRVARCAVRKQTTIYLELEAFSTPRRYTLELRLTDYTPADAHEPNDILNQARLLTPGQHGALVLGGGHDWFAVDCDPAQVVRARAQAQDGSELELELSTWSGASYVPAGKGAGEVRCRARAKRVMLHVSGPRDAAYALELALDDGPAPDAFEPNEGRTPPVLAPGQHANLWADPEDRYRLEVPEGQRLRVRVVTEGPELEVSLGATDGSMNPSRYGQEVVFEHVAPAGGATLRLDVQATQLQRYRIEVELEQGVERDPYEPNDTRQSAKPLPVGQHALRLIGEDWFRFDLAQGETLEVQVLEGPGDLELSLHDAAGLRRAEGRQVTFTSERAGTYTLRVAGDAAAAPAYRLQVMRIE